MALKWTPPDPQDLIAAYLSGESEQALSIRYGVSRTPVRRFLLASGIARRTIKEATAAHLTRTTSSWRLARVRAAHAAVRGRKHSASEKRRRATTRQLRQIGISPKEAALRAMLHARGLDVIAQQAVGPYNADLGAFPVAVEVFGGNWHGYGRHFDRARRRLKYFLDHGWTVVTVWITRAFPLTDGSADQISALHQIVRATPTARRQHWVIGGNGDRFSAGSFYFDKAAGILAPHRRSNI